MKTKAIFLDRDGVINKEKNYLYKISDFEFIDGVFDAMKYLQKKGYKLFIITNQSGIGRGYYTKKDFSILTAWLLREFQKRNINISQIEYCPHIPSDNCKCRKPDILMIDNILSKHNIDLDSSWLIGDKSSDIKCAENANIKYTIQVRSGHDFNTSEADYIIDTFSYNNIYQIL